MTEQEELQKIKEVLIQSGFEMNDASRIFETARKMLDVMVSAVRENEPYAFNSLSKMENAIVQLDDAYHRVNDLLLHEHDVDVKKSMTERYAQNIYKTLLENYEDYMSFEQNGLIYEMNLYEIHDDLRRRLPEPNEWDMDTLATIQRELPDYEYVTHKNYREALYDWKDSIETEMDELGLVDEKGKWTFYLVYDELTYLGFDDGYVMDKLIEQSEVYRKATAIYDKAFELGILKEDPEHKGNVLLDIWTDDQLYTITHSMSQLDAVYHFVNNDNIDKLAMKCFDVIKYGYAKDLNAFVKHIDIEDCDIQNKLGNLLDGSQIDNNVFDFFMEEQSLQEMIAHKVIDTLQTNQEAVDNLQNEMDNFAKWYGEREFNQMDYTDALYNCDDLYLGAIKEIVNELNIEKYNEQSYEEKHPSFEDLVRNAESIKEKRGKNKGQNPQEQSHKKEEKIAGERGCVK